MIFSTVVFSFLKFAFRRCDFLMCVCVCVYVTVHLYIRPPPAPVSFSVTATKHVPLVKLRLRTTEAELVVWFQPGQDWPPFVSSSSWSVPTPAVVVGYDFFLLLPRCGSLNLFSTGDRIYRWRRPFLTSSSELNRFGTYFLWLILFFSPFLKIQICCFVGTIKQQQHNGTFL